MLDAILGGSPRIRLIARGRSRNSVGSGSQDIGEPADERRDPLVVFEDPLHRIQQTPGGTDHFAGS